MTDLSRLVRFTSAGLAELVTAKNQGLKGAVTHIAAGSASYTPDGTETALRAEKQRVAIGEYEDLGPGQIRMAALFNGSLEYSVGEFGFFLESGTLLAVYSVAGQILNYKAATAVLGQKFTLDISTLPTDSVTVVVGGGDMNVMLAEEFAALSTASIDNMARHVGLLFRVMDLEVKK
ncbi:hypothetical protein [Pseudomonas monsensis]|uniref:hypothetical protein n=1 Tax=Pseudomonas monsensis TaxID=2745509 RepID=UPI003D1C5477